MRSRYRERPDYRVDLSFPEVGRLLASFTQDAMIRALAGPAASVPSASRL